MSGKFRILKKKVREICHWSGKFQGFGRCFIHAHDGRPIGFSKNKISVSFVGFLLTVLTEFHSDVTFIKYILVFHLFYILVFHLFWMSRISSHS